MNFPLIADPLAGLHRLGHAVARDRAADWKETRRLASIAVSRLIEMASPRGRCNRKAFLNIALTFLGLQMGLAGVLWLLDIQIGMTGTILVNAPILWIGTTVCFKRLHDIGRRGWWLPGAFAVWFVSAMVIATIVSMALGDEALAEGQPAFMAMFAVITLPAFGALLWLHTRSSEPVANQFGPVPTGFGLSLPAPRSPAREARTFYASAVLA